jgi:hypothetical protein
MAQAGKPKESDRGKSLRRRSELVSILQSDHRNTSELIVILTLCHIRTDFLPLLSGVIATVTGNTPLSFDDQTSLRRQPPRLRQGPERGRQHFFQEVRAACRQPHLRPTRDRGRCHAKSRLFPQARPWQLPRTRRLQLLSLPVGALFAARFRRKEKVDPAWIDYNLKRKKADNFSRSKAIPSFQLRAHNEVLGEVPEWCFFFFLSEPLDAEKRRSNKEGCTCPLPRCKETGREKSRTVSNTVAARRAASSEIGTTVQTNVVTREATGT